MKYEPVRGLVYLTTVTAYIRAERRQKEGFAIHDCVGLHAGDSRMRGGVFAFPGRASMSRLPSREGESGMLFDLSRRVAA